MGRALTFDEDKVILKAQELFWAKGYSNTSLNDILDATGLHKGSLYRVFKSKEKLFFLALQKYGEQSRSKFIQNQDPLLYLKEFFEQSIKESLESCNGCFIMSSCVELGSSKSFLAKVSKSLFEEVSRNFETALKLALDKKQIAPSSDIEDLSTRLVAAAFSIREMSKFIKDEEKFKRIANGTLKEIGIKL